MFSWRVLGAVSAQGWFGGKRCDCPSSCSMLYSRSLLPPQHLYITLCYTITNTPRPPSLRKHQPISVYRRNVDNAMPFYERGAYIYKNKWTKDDDFSFIFSLRFSRAGVSVYDCIYSLAALSSLCCRFVLCIFQMVSGIHDIMLSWKNSHVFGTPHILTLEYVLFADRLYGKAFCVWYLKLKNKWSDTIYT